MAKVEGESGLVTEALATFPTKGHLLARNPRSSKLEEEITVASVTLEGAKKIFDGKVIAVHDFNLQIKEKELMVFVGPSASVTPKDLLFE